MQAAEGKAFNHLTYKLASPKYWRRHKRLQLGWGMSIIGQDIKLLPVLAIYHIPTNAQLEMVDALSY